MTSNLSTCRRVRVSWPQVNRALTDLAEAPNDNRRRVVLNRIRSDCSPMNQKWIVRVSEEERTHVMTGQVTTRYEMSEMSMYSCIYVFRPMGARGGTVRKHRDLERVSESSLVLVCWCCMPFRESWNWRGMDFCFLCVNTCVAVGPSPVRSL